MLLNRDSLGIWSTIAKRAFKAVFNRPDEQSISQISKEIAYDSGEITAYIHFPFCRSVCLYCPYVRYPLSKFGEDAISRYVEALKSEIELYGLLFKDLDLKIVDVHIGGGTPSLLKGEHFKAIIEALGQSFDLKSKLAIEANPDDLKVVRVSLYSQFRL